jgi:hypothetical protein
MLLGRMLVLCLAIAPDGADGNGKVVAYRYIRISDYHGSPSNLG